MEIKTPAFIWICNIHILGVTFLLNRSLRVALSYPRIRIRVHVRVLNYLCSCIYVDVRETLYGYQTLLRRTLHATKIVN